MHTPISLGPLFMDGGDTATQEAKAEDEAVLRCFALTPALSRRERAKSDAHYLLIGLVYCRLSKEMPGTSGTVINSGTIYAALGGNVALLGKRVENNGLITANLGTVTLAAGKQAALTFDNGGLLGVRVSQEILQIELGMDPAVLNSGTIQASGGKELLTASVSQDIIFKALNTTGIY